MLAYQIDRSVSRDLRTLPARCSAALSAKRLASESVSDQCKKREPVIQPRVMRLGLYSSDMRGRRTARPVVTCWLIQQALLGRGEIHHSGLRQCRILRGRLDRLLQAARHALELGVLIDAHRSVVDFAVDHG